MENAQKVIKKSHEIWLCNYLKKSFFNFLISSGLSVTSFRHIQKVIKSLKIGKRSLKTMKNTWNVDLLGVYEAWPVKLTFHQDHRLDMTRDVAEALGPNKPISSGFPN